MQERTRATQLLDAGAAIAFGRDVRPADVAGDLAAPVGTHRAEAAEAPPHRSATM